MLGAFLSRKSPVWIIDKPVRFSAISLFLFNNPKNSKVLLTQTVSLSVSEKITKRLIILPSYINNSFTSTQKL